MNLMFQPLRKYADFNGRARRSEFWLFTLLYVILFLPFYVMMFIAGVSESDAVAGVAAVVMLLVLLALLLPSLAVTVRRLHDTNRSGWWYLISFIPFGSLVLFVFTVLDGTPGPNKYGSDPKGRGDAVASVFA